jgi:hypothetical protein
MGDRGGREEDGAVLRPILLLLLLLHSARAVRVEEEGGGGVQGEMHTQWHRGSRATVACGPGLHSQKYTF